MLALNVCAANAQITDDGQSLVSINNVSHTIEVRHLLTGNLMHTMADMHNCKPVYMSLVPDRHLLVTVGVRGDIHLWDVCAGECDNRLIISFVRPAHSTIQPRCIKDSIVVQSLRSDSHTIGVHCTRYWTATKRIGRVRAYVGGLKGIF